MGATDQSVEQLQREYGIYILKSDTSQSPQVLANLFFLLHNALTPSCVKKIKTFRYVKASRDKNPREEISSFNLDEMTIEVPDISFDNEFKLGAQNQIKLIAALAHEIGHAFLFQSISVNELINIGNRFGGWEYTHNSNKASTSLRSEQFFQHHPKFCIKCKLASDKNHFSIELKRNNISSEYALEDIHEWFAESFAAYLLMKLGRQGLLGKDWHKNLVLIPHSNREYWVNYNNISPEFIDWLEQKLSTT